LNVKLRLYLQVIQKCQIISTIADFSQQESSSKIDHAGADPALDDEKTTKLTNLKLLLQF